MATGTSDPTGKPKRGKRMTSSGSQKGRSHGQGPRGLGTGEQAQQLVGRRCPAGPATATASEETGEARSCAAAPGQRTGGADDTGDDVADVACGAGPV